MYKYIYSNKRSNIVITFRIKIREKQSKMTS